MIELWHATHSTCSQKVRLCLAEKQLAWTSHRVDLRRFEHLEPAFLALNPAAMVPVLRHGGRLVRESLVINEYLDDAFPEPALRPRDALGRARMREWTLYVAEEPTWAVKAPSFEKNIRPQLAGRHSQAEIEAIAARMPNRETAARWVKAVRDGFPRGEIDAALQRLERNDMAPFVHRIAALDASLVEARPHVADWYRRIRSRPAFGEAIPA
jgi:glutathione S-transferase